MTLPRKKTITITAPTWKRMLAFLIDYIIINSFILFPFNTLTKKIAGGGDFSSMLYQLSNGGLFKVGTVAISMSLICFLYFVLMEQRMNQTIGKMLLTIEVKGIKTPWQAMQRSLGVFFLFLMPVITLVDAAYVYFNKDGLRFSERLSKTSTIQKVQL